MKAKMTLLALLMCFTLTAKPAEAFSIKRFAGNVGLGIAEVAGCVALTPLYVVSIVVVLPLAIVGL